MVIKSPDYDRLPFGTPNETTPKINETHLKKACQLMRQTIN